MLLTASALGITYQVGTCRQTLIIFPTISAAVNGVPSGSTIEICPGTYPEQVVITQPLTLEEVPGVSGEVVIVVPPGGLTQTVNSWAGDFAYQVLVQSAGPVNLSNLAVDGAGASNQNYVAGVVYLDSSGNADHLSVRNQLGGINAVGLLAVTSGPTPQTVTVSSSVFRGFYGIGVWAISGDAVVTTNLNSNTIHAQETQLNWQIDVWYYYASGTVQSNQITGALNGVDVANSSSVNVTQNYFTGLTHSLVEPAYAIQVSQSSANVTNNTIDAGTDSGIFLVGSGNNSAIQHNTIGNSSGAVVGCDIVFAPPPASGFVVSSNTITDAASGLQVPSGNTTTPNNYYAVGNATVPCT
jgi:parallel beta-helix repeat protein